MVVWSIESGLIIHEHPPSLRNVIREGTFELGSAAKSGAFVTFMMVCPKIQKFLQINCLLSELGQR